MVLYLRLGGRLLILGVLLLLLSILYNSGDYLLTNKNFLMKLTFFIILVQILSNKVVFDVWLGQF